MSSGAMSNYLEAKLLDLTFNKVAFTGPTTFLALYTTPIGEDGTGGVEVTGGSYGRVLVLENAATGTPRWKLAASEGGGGFVVENLHEIAFAQATAAWGTVKGFAVLDALTGAPPTGANVLVHGPLAKTPFEFVGENGTDKIFAPGHTFANDQKVVFRPGPGGLPGGVTVDTEYFVISAATDEFQISTTQGGGAVNITTDGEGTVWASMWKVVGDSDTLKFPANDLDIIFR